MKKYILPLVLALELIIVSSVFSHCEIPCGIYDDHLRFKMISENISTIEKSMKMINKLSAAEKINYNQLVRWINNKDTHATEIQHIVSQYFMTQRVKLVDVQKKAEYEIYLKKLALLHELLVYSMKAKQTTDLQHVEKLKSILANFEELYFGKEKEHK